MSNERRYHATNRLREELAEQERSISWLARKARVSQQLMSFVLRRERTIGETPATLAAAALGKDLEVFFAPVVTSVTQSDTGERIAA